MSRLLALLLLLALPARAEVLTVFAASSLREAFMELARSFQSAHAGVEVAIQFAGSQDLRVQIENGAAADVFASADEKQMDRARALVGEPVIFAHNQPVVIVPKDNPAGLKTFDDLPKARRVVLGAQEVPIGAYSEKILAAAKIDLSARIVSRELNVRQVLAKVALGEADAGIVYRTDAVTSKDVRTIEIPAQHNVQAAYPIAVLRTAHDPALAAQFVALVLSPTGRAELGRQGFSP